MSTVPNLLVQIKNAQAVGAAEVSVPFSKLSYAIAEVLTRKGLIKAVEKKKKKLRKVEVDWLTIELKYTDGNGAITGLKLISKPSRRVYAGKAELYPVKSGFGFALVSTPRGVMTGVEARQAGLGGEVLFEVW